MQIQGKFEIHLELIKFVKSRHKYQLMRSQNETQDKEYNLLTIKSKIAIKSYFFLKLRIKWVFDKRGLKLNSMLA